MTYFYGLLLFSFLTGAVEYLCPGGEGGVRRHLRLLCGLLVLAALFRPLYGFVTEIAAGDPAEKLTDLWNRATGDTAGAELSAKKQWEDELARLDAALAAEKIGELLCERYGVPPGSLSVKVRPDETGEKVGHVSVALSGRSIWLNATEIEDYLCDTFSCTSTVYVEQGGDE